MSLAQATKDVSKVIEDVAHDAKVLECPSLCLCNMRRVVPLSLNSFDVLTTTCVMLLRSRSNSRSFRC